MIKGFKTFVFGAALIVLAVLGDADVQAFLADRIEWFAGLTGTLIIVLRAFTSSPMFKGGVK